MNLLRFLTPKSAVCYLYHDFTLRQALEKMFYHRHHAVPVIDRKGRYVGSVSDGDFLRILYEQESGDLHTLEHRRLKDIVMTGNLTSIPYCKTVMEKLNEMFDVRFLIPDLATYGTVIGTALRG